MQGTEDSPYKGYNFKVTLTRIAFPLWGWEGREHVTMWISSGVSGRYETQDVHHTSDSVYVTIQVYSSKNCLKSSSHSDRRDKSQL